MNKIKCCEDCPMNVPGGEYSGYCNHPSAPTGSDGEQKIIYYDFGIKQEELPIDSETGKKYHFETNANPPWCPLRQLKSIDIGVKIEVELDKNLFEENFLEGGKFYSITRKR